MSISETLKTRTGIKRFMLPNENEDETVIAFEYLDKKTEVHLLKQECAPLYLEENAKVSLLNMEHGGIFLLAVTPNVKQGKCSIVFRLWDSNSIMGFTPKEIQIIDSEQQVTQDGKFRSILNLNEGMSDTSSVKLDSLDSLVALFIENEIFMWKAGKKDPNIVSLQFNNNIKLKTCHPDIDMTFLQVDGECSLVVGEPGCLSFWNLDSPDILVSKSLALPQSPSGSLLTPKKFHRVSKSKLVFTGDCGSLFAFSLKTNCLANVKLPGLQNGCNVFSIARRKLKNSIILAVCNEAHTVNIYELSDVACDRFQDVILCERPFKVLFSTAPVDALGFVKQGVLALASCSNRTLTLWTVFS